LDGKIKPFIIVEIIGVKNPTIKMGFLAPILKIFVKE
jgi:hypothetical protein